MLTGSRASEAVLSVGSFCVLLAGMSVANEDMRGYVANALAGDPSGQLAGLATRTVAFAHVLFDTFGDYRIANGPMMMFAVGSAILLFFMLQAKVGG